MGEMNRYQVYVKLVVVGESPDDAIEYATTALDISDLLDQDGVVGIELIDDVDSVELADEDENDGEDIV